MGMEVSHPQASQRADDRYECACVNQEHITCSHRGDQHASDGWADHARGIERCGVQAYRVRQVGFAHQLGNKGLPCGRVESRGAAQQECEHIDVPQLHKAGDREDTQGQPQRSHDDLGDHEELAPVEMVGGEAAERQHQQMRAELQRRDDTQGGGITVRQLGEHQPILGGALHPCAHVGHQSAAGPDAIVVAVQRAEHTCHQIE